jgi:hypothetical protein
VSLMSLQPSHSGKKFSFGANALTFLQHLKEAIRKHTMMDPESQVREVLLKGKFLTVSPRYL